MAKKDQINIRFDERTNQILTATTEKLGCSRSALVRRLTEVFLQEVEKTGSVKLDAGWISKLRAADGRTKWVKPKTDDKTPPLDNPHPTPNTQHPTPNTQHPTPNTQHPTPNTQHPTPNVRKIAYAGHVKGGHETAHEQQGKTPLPLAVVATLGGIPVGPGNGEPVAAQPVRRSDRRRGGAAGQGR